MTEEMDEAVVERREGPFTAAQEAECLEKRIKLSELLASQPVNLLSMPKAVVQAWLDVLELNGIDRLVAMTDIIKTIEDLCRDELEGTF
jgi:hypothetical protein